MGAGDPVGVCAVGVVVPPGVALGHALGVLGGRGDDGHVGQLAVVGTSERVQADEIQGVRVHVVSGDHGDDGGRVVRLHEAVVVGSHVGETLGVLVDEGGIGDGVVSGEVAVEDEGGGGSRAGADRGLAGGVVGPVGADGSVLGGEEEHLDGVGETDVEGGGGGGHQGLLRGGLDLLDEDITRGTGHALTLVVGHNGVVGPHLGVVGDSDSGSGGKIAGGGRASGLDEKLGVAAAVGRVHLPDVEEIGKVAEGEEDAHVVVRKRGRGEGHTGIARVEERKREVECPGGKGRGGIDELGDVSDHVVVTHLFAGGGGEGGPEIQVEVIETGGHEVVEGDAALAHKVVHEIGRPGDVLVAQVVGGSTLDLCLTGSRGTGDAGGRDGGNGHTEPGVEEVISGTGNRHGPVVSEIGGSGGTGETDGHLGEPGRAPGLAHKVRGRVLSSIHILLEFIVGRKIDETGRKIRCTILRHSDKIIR